MIHVGHFCGNTVNNTVNIMFTLTVKAFIHLFSSTKSGHKQGWFVSNIQHVKLDGKLLGGHHILWCVFMAHVDSLCSIHSPYVYNHKCIGSFYSTISYPIRSHRAMPFILNYFPTYFFHALMASCDDLKLVIICHTLHYEYFLHGPCTSTLHFPDLQRWPKRLKSTWVLSD